MQRGQILPREGSGQSHHRRPQAAMHVGNLPADQATNEDIARAPNGTREPEDLVALRVAPPARVSVPSPRPPRGWELVREHLRERRRGGGRKRGRPWTS